MHITEHQTLHVQNLITIRQKMKQEEMPIHLKKLLDYITLHGAKKVGGFISATYGITDGSMDAEIYIPIDKEIPSQGELIYKPELLLTNCLKVTYIGNPQLLQKTLDELNQFIAMNKLMPISVGFNVTIHEITDPADIELFEVETYVSISGNVI
jgi:hypothetical protein